MTFKQLQRLFIAWDRATAFGRAQRGLPFDPALEQGAREVYFRALDQREEELRVVAQSVECGQSVK